MRQFVLIILVFLGMQIEAQSEVNFTQDYWLGYGVEFKLLKKTEVKLEAQQRFETEAGAIEQNLIEVGLVRKTSRYSKFGLRYRTSWEYKEEHRVNRYAGFYKLTFSEGNFKFNNRLGVQFDVTNYTGETKSHLRNKIGTEYDKFKKVKPYLSYDVSFRFDNRNHFNNHRFSVGSSIKLKKNVKLNLFVRFDNETNRNQPQRELIYCSNIVVKI